MASGPITSWQIDGEKVEAGTDFIFLGSKITADGDCSPEIKRRLVLGKKAMKNLDSILKSRDISLLTKVHIVNTVVFLVVMYGYESWTIRRPKNWCFSIVVLEKTLESPLDSREIKPVSPKGNQPWIFNGRTDAEAPILWPPDAKSRLPGKAPDAGKDWRQEEKGATGWGGWMASLTQRTWVRASYRSWWWTGKPGVLQSTRSQRVGHDLATERQQQDSFYCDKKW